MQTVEFDGVSFLRSGRAIISDLSFAVPRGSLRLLLGPNGAGKTTLFNLIAGFERPSAGEVRVLGENVGRRNAAALRRRIGYVMQSESFDAMAPVTVREAVAFGRLALLGPRGRAGKSDHLAVDEVLERMGLRRLAERPAGVLSGGELQRMRLARALAQAPELLLLDEPVSNLDLQARREVVSLVEEMKGEMTIVAAFHDLGFLPRSADAALLIQDGRLTANGPAAEVLERIENLYDPGAPAEPPAPWISSATPF